MSDGGTNTLGGSANTSGNEPDDHTPVRKHVTKIEKMGVGGANTQFQRHYCQQTWKGSYSRVKAHLLKISGQGI